MATSKKTTKAATKTSASKTNAASKPRKKVAATVVKSSAKASTAKRAVKSTTPARQVAQSATLKAQLSLLSEEFEQLTQLKEWLDSLGEPIKRGEILRAGLHQLAKMNDARLRSSIAAVPVIGSTTK